MNVSLIRTWNKKEGLEGLHKTVSKCENLVGLWVGNGGRLVGEKISESYCEFIRVAEKGISDRGKGQELSGLHESVTKIDIMCSFAENKNTFSEIVLVTPEGEYF